MMIESSIRPISAPTLLQLRRLRQTLSQLLNCITFPFPQLLASSTSKLWYNKISYPERRSRILFLKQPPLSLINCHPRSNRLIHHQHNGSWHASSLFCSAHTQPQKEATAELRPPTHLSPSCLPRCWPLWRTELPTAALLPARWLPTTGIPPARLIAPAGHVLSTTAEWAATGLLCERQWL